MIAAFKHWSRRVIPRQLRVWNGVAALILGLTPAVLAGEVGAPLRNDAPLKRLEGDPAHGGGWVVLYLPPRPEPGAGTRVEVDFQALQQNLPNYLRLPPSETEYMHIFQPAFRCLFQQGTFQTPHENGATQSSSVAVSDECSGETSASELGAGAVSEAGNLSSPTLRLPQDIHCGEDFTGDFFRQKLAEVALLLIDGTFEEDFPSTIETLIKRFNCQNAGDFLSTTELRQVLLYLGFAEKAGNREDYRRHFAAAYALGTRDVLGDGLAGMFAEGDHWEDYSQAVRELHTEDPTTQRMAARRIPVFFNVSRLPSLDIRVDGESITPRRPSIGPILLYPGRHFLQLRDTRGRLHSATMEVPANQPSFVLELGKEASDSSQSGQALFPPQRDEADELLWKKLNNSSELSFVLPEWLTRGLTDYLNRWNLKGIFVVAPVDSREEDPSRPLMVARFEADQGLVEIGARQQGESYKPLAKWGAQQGRAVPGNMAIGVGGGSIAGRSLATLEGRYALLRREGLELHLGTTASLLRSPADETRVLGAAWIGLTREPSEVRLGWFYGASLGMTVPGPAVKPAARALAGVEWPLAERRLGRRVLWPALRFELQGTVVTGLNETLTTLEPVELLLEGRLAMRFWHWETEHP